VHAVWNLIGSNNLPGVADDSVRGSLPYSKAQHSLVTLQLVSQSLRFLSTAIRTGLYKSLFSTRDTISSLVQGIVVPNVTLREHDVEQFEDDPLEFIRLDLALSSTGTDLATRRQAAADVLQALVGAGSEAVATEVAGEWIGSGLAQYDANKSENWKAKDSAVYLLTAVATRGSTSQVGTFSALLHDNTHHIL
jgi:exportin-2 (importin alpha re-exporter)